MRTDEAYEMVVGLETHVELRTRSKVFCACANEYGAAPNTRVCPVCMGLPGALPVFNREALRLAALAGLAVHCHVHHNSRFDRKNYFYPDLPKAYQISQFYHPLCERGFLTIQTVSGEKRVGITRIHIEEDAGKLIHNANATALDMNRCGVPLIEIVSEPDIRNAEEAVSYLRKLRAVLTYAGVSDCRMNEGSMRCDVNLSVHKPGEPFGTRTEMKNLNSFQSVERAIEAEYQRQVRLIMDGGIITQETRRYDQKTGQTSGMRRKEDSADYRYFPDPDLPEIHISDDELDALRAVLPALPDERRARYARDYALSAYTAELLTSERWLADYFEEAAQGAQDPAHVANLLLGEASALMTMREAGQAVERSRSSLPVFPAHIRELSDMMVTGRVNSSTGKRILAELFRADISPEACAKAWNCFALTDDGMLREAVQKVIAANPDMTTSYQNGKLGVFKALMGRAMAETRGRADPERLTALLREALGPK